MLSVGVDSWIIQDGNYEDFRVSQERAFALRFWPHDLKPTHAREKQVVEVNPAQYLGCGEVVYCTPACWVIDVGFLAYTDAPLIEGLSDRAWLAGTFYLGIDPFDYFEELYQLPEMPDLNYQWRIDSILLETTPWLESKDDEGRKCLYRDKAREGYQSIERSSAWDDDGGHAHYVLGCTNVDSGI